MTTTNKWAEYATANLLPKNNVNRHDDTHGNRFYYFRNDNNERIVAAGITTWLSKVMPESPFLTDWKIKWGKDWKHLLNLTSDYGTLLHICYAHIMIHREHPPQEYIDDAKSIIRELKRYDKTVNEDMIDKNIICFYRFMEEYNLKPLLIEALLTCRAITGDYYCLTQDLLATIDNPIKTKVEVQDGFYVKGEKKGQPKFITETKTDIVTETICLDFKSNPFDKDKKSFFDTHMYQLMGTEKAVEQNFGIKIDRLYNFSPNNWKTDTGDYTLHEWKPTEKDYEVFNILESLASKKGAFIPKGQVTVFEKWREGMKHTDLVKKFYYTDYLDYMDEQAEKVESQVLTPLP